MIHRIVVLAWLITALMGWLYLTAQWWMAVVSPMLPERFP
jgi:hypothetical protein